MGRPTLIYDWAVRGRREGGSAHIYFLPALAKKPSSGEGGGQLYVIAGLVSLRKGKRRHETPYAVLHCGPPDWGRYCIWLYERTEPRNGTDDR